MPAGPPVPDYDRVWDEVYGDMQEYGPTHRHMLRLMRRLLAPLEYRSLLEVGVGFGHNLPVLTQGRELERLAGIDISQRAVDHVRARWSGEFHKLDITGERLPDTFELVCCALLLEHVLDDAAAMSNLRAMSARYLLVSTMGGDFDRYRSWEEQVGHVRNYQPDELERKLDAAGFETINRICWGFPLYSPLQRSLQNHVTAGSELSAGSRLMARLLYRLFFLNSSRRGDLILLLARVRP